MLKKYDIFFQSIDIENNLINNLNKLVNYKFKWEYTKRYFIDKNYFNFFFTKKKKFQKKMTRIINKKNLITKKLQSNKEKLIYLQKHIKLKSMQYELKKLEIPLKILGIQNCSNLF